MIKLVPSLLYWLKENHSDALSLILRGWTEYFSNGMAKGYLNWCQTPEGKYYLKKDEEQDNG